MRRRSLIYRITNTVNGQVYIGLTRRGANVRWTQHKSRARLGVRKTRLYEAMRELGIENFKFEAICYVLDEKELPALERHFIAQHDSFHHGYNSTDGGESLAPEARAKISKANKARKAPWAVNNWDRRRANGTANIDMRKHVPSGASNPQAKRYRVRDPNGVEFVVHGMNAFCKANGLTFKAMCDTMNGVQTHHKGYVMLGYAANDSISLSRESISVEHISIN
jgi:GIY-YIG catalytic domain